MRCRTSILALALSFGLFCAVAASARPAEVLPTSHWAYRDLDALWSRGALDSLNLLVRPWSRIDIARSLKEGRERDPELARDPVYRRLAWQFSRELGWLGTDEAPPETPPLLGLQSEGEEFRVQAGLDVAGSGAPPSKMQISPGSGGFVSAKAYLWPHVYIGAEVWAERTGSDRELGDALIKGEDLYLTARDTYVSFAARSFELMFGLREESWGPGRRGSLLLGDAAQPFLNLRMAATIAGRVHLTAIHGSLVQSDHRYVAAHRLSVDVTSNLTLGVSEAARYDAHSPEMLYVLNLIPYTIVERYIVQHREKTTEIDTRNNVMMAFDGVWRIRPGFRVWGEFLIDELSTESASIPHRLAWQIGGSVHPQVADRPAEVSFEYAKVFRYTYSVFYDRNYIFADEPLGYVDGPDSEHYGVGLKVDFSSSWWGDLDLTLGRRGQGTLGEFWDPAEPEDAWSGLGLSGSVESTIRAFATAAWVPRDNLRAEAGLGVRHVRNALHHEGDNRTDPEAMVRLYLRK